MANFIIDKSRYTPEQLAQYEELVAIGKAEVDPEAALEEMEEEMPPAPPKKKTTEKAEVETMETKKSAPEVAPEIQAAMDELAALKKSYEMDKMIEVAKKYAPLGKNETELAKTLHDMKAANEANYNAYIAVLDESLGYVEKSGLFSEIGKSGHNGSYTAASGAEGKAEAKAAELMKAHPDMTHTEAIAKAWEDPAIMAEYEAEYGC